MALAVPVVLAQALLVANLSGQLLRGALRGIRAFRCDLWGDACAMVGGRTMAGGRAVWLLEKTRRHMGRKSRDLGGKRCRLFAALACGVGDKVAGRCGGGGGSAGRIKRHVYRQGGRHDFLPFLLHSFRPVRFVPFSLFVQTPCAPLTPHGNSGAHGVAVRMQSGFYAPGFANQKGKSRGSVSTMMTPMATCRGRPTLM